MHQYILHIKISLFSRQLFPRLHPVHNAKECLDLVLSILAITAKEAQSKILSNFQKVSIVKALFHFFFFVSIRNPQKYHTLGH